MTKMATMLIYGELKIFFKNEQPMTLTLSVHHGIFEVCQVCSNGPRLIFEPIHEIMAFFVLRNLILQTRMRSHRVGLDV